MLRSLELAAALATTAPSLFRFDGLAASSAVAALNITPGRRDELLRDAVARKHVELELGLRAYQQAPKGGKPNRKFVRFSDKSLPSMAKSAVGRPFIRDHMQADVLARSGTILTSQATTRAGLSEIWMNVRLTEPGAVERALRELMGGVSIGIRPTGPIACTVCNAEIFTKTDCIAELHLPGTETDDGAVEWEYSSAEIVETSECSVPAVADAGIESIRDAVRSTLSAAGAPLRTKSPARDDGDMWTRVSRWGSR